MHARRLDMRIKEKGGIFNQIEEYLAVLLLALMVIIVFEQVILRYVFNQSNAWSEETARYMFIWFTFFSASVAILKEAHIRIETIIKLYPRKARTPITLLGYGVFFAYCIAMIRFGSGLVTQAYQMETITLGARIPFYWVYLSLPLSHVFMAIRIIQVCIRIIIRKDYAPSGSAESVEY